MKKIKLLSLISLILLTGCCYSALNREKCRELIARNEIKPGMSKEKILINFGFPELLLSHVRKDTTIVCETLVYDGVTFDFENDQLVNIRP